MLNKINFFLSLAQINMYFYNLQKLDFLSTDRLYLRDFHSRKTFERATDALCKNP